MNDYLEGAKEELKRVDHIIYVSLKYTRTVDIIRNALHRLVSAFELILEGLLSHSVDRLSGRDVPKSPRGKISLAEDIYGEDVEILRFLKFYSFLRDLVKAPYTRREEYRRHVTMISDLGNKTAEVDIDVLEDQFDKIAKSFLNYVEGLMGLHVD
jgi:hypothetical protein